MSITELAARQPGATDFSSLLSALGVRRESLIQITGPDGLAALLWLCRHGFEHAAYVKPGAPCPSEPADALIAPHAMTREALVRLLEAGPKVRPGGALILQALRGAPGRGEDDGEESLAVLLERYGWRIAARFDRGARELVAARRRQSAYAEAA